MSDSEKLANLLRQTWPVINAIERAVPERSREMHPKLVALFDMAQAWRNYVEETPRLMVLPEHPSDEAVRAYGHALRAWIREGTDDDFAMPLHAAYSAERSAQR